MDIVYKKLTEIKPYEKNPRQNDDAVQYVAESIKEFGFKVPIVIDKNNVIVAGHTRYKASQELGLEEVPCIIADDLTDEQVKAFRVADNKTSDYSLWDNKLLLEELDSISEDLFTGFDLGEIFDKTVDDSNIEITLDENTAGLVYKITFESQSEYKINKIKELWEEMENE